MASQPIDQLELEITSSATSAAKGIDALAESLNRLKGNSKGNGGLSTLAKHLETLSNASKTITAADVVNLRGFSNALASLKGLSGVKIPSSIGKQLKDIAVSLAGVNTGEASVKISELANALTPLSNLPVLPSGSVFRQIAKLPKILEALNETDLQTFKIKMQEVAAAMKPLGDEMAKVAAGFSAFPAKIQRFLNAANKVPPTNNKVAKSYAHMALKMGGSIFVLQRVARAIAYCVNESNKYIENLNLFNVSMGEFAEEAKQYAEYVGEVVGIDPSEWMRNQGVFQTLATGFGVASDRAYIMSKNLTQLGYDLSSFFNISTASSFQKLQSGLAGELEPLTLAA